MTYFNSQSLQDKKIKDVFNKVKNADFNLSDEEKKTFVINYKSHYDVWGFFRDKSAELETEEKIVEYFTKYFQLVHSLNDNRVSNITDVAASYQFYRSMWDYYHNSKITQPAMVYKTYLMSKKITNENYVHCIKAIGYGHIKDVESINNLIDYFTPDVFKSRADFINRAYKIGHKTLHMFYFLSYLEDQSTDKDREILYQNVKAILLKRAMNTANTNIVSVALGKQYIIDNIKNDYNDQMKERIKAYLPKIGFKNLENYDYQLCKAIVNLDDSLLDSVQSSYISSVLGRRIGIYHANKRRIVKFLTTIPGAKPKNALLQILQHNSNMDISFMTNKFTELKKFSILI